MQKQNFLQRNRLYLGYWAAILEELSLKARSMSQSMLSERGRGAQMVLLVR